MPFEENQKIKRLHYRKIYSILMERQGVLVSPTSIFGYLRLILPFFLLSMLPVA